MPNFNGTSITIPDSPLFSIHRLQEKLEAPAITSGVLRAAPLAPGERLGLGGVVATTISGGFELGSYKSVADWMATVAELRQLQWIGDSHSSRRRDAVMEVAGWCWAEGSTTVIAGFTGGDLQPRLGDGVCEQRKWSDLKRGDGGWAATRRLSFVAVV
ncbi:hypothetical protein CASFOL_027283 [Castilleja foliolosa]|uniref:Uncharacterized protein n=1 Tax=Castilleja foliolosa TaxID=1961234 RepID=A0ABD3CFF8_9LAMI